MSIVFHESSTTPQSWQVPGFEADPEQRQGWVEEVIQEGEGYQSGSRAYANLQQSMRTFDGVFTDKVRSTLYSNFLKYNIRKFVETLADVREIGLYGSDAVQYKPYAEVENRVAKCIYLESQYPRQLRRALQYAAVTGIGYLWAKCKAEDYGFGERRIVYEPLGLLDVLPVQVPSSNDVQDAYACTIYEYMPIAEAHGRFPLFQSKLQPVDRMTQPSGVSAKRLAWASTIRYGEQSRSWGNLYCEIRYTFVRDLRINNLGVELPMGDEGTSWFYKVPCLGQEIFGGIRKGKPFMRPAALQDCRVYPNLRLIISNPGMKQPMYDGPAFDWHGKIPVVQFTVDDWPWEPLGLSLVDAVGSIEMTKRKHERLMDQIVTATENPPMGYDRSGTAGPKIENFDLFEQNVRMGVDGKPQDVFHSILPEEVRVTDINFKMIEYLKTIEEQQLGINDLGNIASMKLNVSADSFDKAVEPIGPIAKGIATSMEASNSKIAYMLKFQIAQWMDTARIIEYIGPDNITPEMYDFDPESLIPSHGPDEYVNVGGAMMLPSDPAEGQEGVLEERPSHYSQMERARVFAKKLRLLNTPSTLLKMTQREEQTKFMALKGRGAPISWHTVMKKLGVENFGEVKGDTEFEKFINEEKEMLLLKAQEAQMAEKLGLSHPPPPQGKQHAGGRPPSDKQAPKQGTKDGGTRPVIKTAR